MHELCVRSSSGVWRSGLAAPLASAFALASAIASAGLLAGACGGEEFQSTGAGATGAATATGGAGGSGATGGSGGAHQTGGHGGGGGHGECASPSDCPGEDSECLKRACIAGACDVDLAQPGKELNKQTAGDCKVVVCDGNGGTKIEETDDAIADEFTCTVEICDGGSPKSVPAELGVACSDSGGKVCDGDGKCVECNAPGDCPGGTCQSNECVPLTCDNGQKDGQETDLDCGGSTCAPCAPGKDCKLASDCSSGVCKADVCAAPTCSDGVKNGLESDVDCGGSCDPCGAGASCGSPNDCESAVCLGAKCQAPTCEDQVENGLESDVDCGGPTCAKCGPGVGCGGSSDCASGQCDDGSCASTCSDGFKGGAETDVDCGGGACGACADDQGCKVDGDCQNHTCNAGKCAPVNGCTLTGAVDATAAATVTITYGASGLVYSPACVRVKVGTTVTFDGAGFSGHPLAGGEVVKGVEVPDASSPFMPITKTGKFKDFPLSVAGRYPYYCDFHSGSGMMGTVFVVE